MLLAVRATVNGRKAVAYVKNGKLQAYEYLDDLAASAAPVRASNLRIRERRCGYESAHLAHRNRVSQSKTKLLPVWCCSNA